MIYKTISSKAIINKVFRDLGVTMAQYTDQLTDAIEQIGEALEGIGSTSPLIQKPYNVVVNDNRFEMPCDLYNIVQLVYNNRAIPYTFSSVDFICEDCVKQPFQPDDRYTFSVVPGWIRTNIPDGETVCLIYKGFAVDDKGYPMIPDDYGHREAIFWFLVMKMMLAGFEHPNKEITYSSAEARWLKYCSQAEANGKMFDVSQYETFRRQWARLVPVADAFDQMFTTNEIEEHISNPYQRKIFYF